MYFAPTLQTRGVNTVQVNSGRRIAAVYMGATRGKCCQMSGNTPGSPRRSTWMVGARTSPALWCCAVRCGNPAAAYLYRPSQSRASSHLLSSAPGRSGVLERGVSELAAARGGGCSYRDRGTSCGRGLGENQQDRGGRGLPVSSGSGFTDPVRFNAVRR